MAAKKAIQCFKILHVLCETRNKISANNRFALKSDKFDFNFGIQQYFSGLIPFCLKFTINNLFSYVTFINLIFCLVHFLVYTSMN